MVNFINFLLLVTPIAVIATLLVASELFDKNLPNEISQSSKETSYVSPNIFITLLLKSLLKYLFRAANSERTF